MTAEKNKEINSRLIRWGKQGGKLRRLFALAVIILLLVYYHSIGRHVTVKRKLGKKGIYRLLNVVSLGTMAICLILIAQEYRLSIEHKKEQENLKAILLAAENRISEEKALPEENMPSDAAPKAETLVVESSISAHEEEPVMLERFKKLYEENSDLVAWLSIEGMVIDYPVMQCEDDEYYLHHDFYGNEDKYGCLYVRNKADVNAGVNFVIYGHNMRDGSMFGDLDLYQKESFYLEHPMISFDTLYDEYTYEIIAVFFSQIYNSDDDTFKYYQFYDADTQEEFDYFYENIKELSLYDTGVTAEFGDTFLTLSTCAYHVDDGRFVVVAKRMEDNALK